MIIRILSVEPLRHRIIVINMNTDSSRYCYLCTIAKQAKT